MFFFLIFATEILFTTVSIPFLPSRLLLGEVPSSYKKRPLENGQGKERHERGAISLELTTDGEHVAESVQVTHPCDGANGRVKGARYQGVIWDEADVLGVWPSRVFLPQAR